MSPLRDIVFNIDVCVVGFGSVLIFSYIISDSCCVISFLFGCYVLVLVFVCVLFLLGCEVCFVFVFCGHRIVANKTP